MEVQLVSRAGVIPIAGEKALQRFHQLRGVLTIVVFERPEVFLAEPVEGGAIFNPCDHTIYAQLVETESAVAAKEALSYARCLLGLGVRGKDIARTGDAPPQAYCRSRAPDQVSDAMACIFEVLAHLVGIQRGGACWKQYRQYVSALSQERSRPAIEDLAVREINERGPKPTAERVLTIVAGGVGSVRRKLQARDLARLRVERQAGGVVSLNQAVAEVLGAALDLVLVGEGAG
jgi:hypothetical protein